MILFGSFQTILWVGDLVTKSFSCVLFHSLVYDAIWMDLMVYRHPLTSKETSNKQKKVDGLFIIIEDDERRKGSGKLYLGQSIIFNKTIYEL